MMKTEFQWRNIFLNHCQQYFSGRFLLLRLEDLLYFKYSTSSVHLPWIFFFNFMKNAVSQFWNVGRIYSTVALPVLIIMSKLLLVLQTQCIIKSLTRRDKLNWCLHLLPGRWKELLGNKLQTRSNQNTSENQ